ncbi:TRS120 targeting complex component [Scheffersomyces xylosifermentans]|uniref:TRS120 targeting complex component n=1 Tax=Scheffersomyces xylosifermentans TaxID=1304137 RepID=UPI00315D6ED9
MSTGYGYTTPARVKSLIVPVNGCTKAVFTSYLEILQSVVHEIRLLDLSPNQKLQYFNPQGFPNGRIFLDFLVSTPDTESIFLHDFEPYRKTFIIVGIAKYTPDFNSETHIQNLKSIYPASIVHNIIVFDTPADIISDLNRPNDHSSKNTFYYNGFSDHNLSALETIKCEIAQNFLLALDNYAASYSNITLRSPISITDSHILTKTINQAQKRISSGSTSFKVSFGGPDTAGASSDKAKSQSRHDGRQSKLMASFYLLAGKYVDALQRFMEAAVTLKKCDDFLWLGSALEGISISVLLLQYIGSPYQLQNQVLSNIIQVSKNRLSGLANNELLSPNRTSLDQNSNGFHKTTSKPGLSPRNSSSSSVSFSFPGGVGSSSASDLSSLPLPEFVRLLSSKVMHFYQLSTNDFENMVPDIVYVEAILRIIKFMIAVHLGGNDSTNLLLENIVTTNASKNTIVDSKYFSKEDILKEIDKVFQLQLVDMGVIEQCRIYSTLATMYTDLGLFRKRAFILRILLVGILPKLEFEKREAPYGDEIDIQNNIASVTGNKDQKQSIRDIFEYMFSIYGINVETESSAVDASIHGQGNWISLQIQLLRLCLKIAESSRDYPFLLKLCTLLLTRYTHCLPTDDQLKLKGKIDHILFLSNRNNLRLSVPYWDPFMVRKVKFISVRNKDEVLPFSEYERGSNNLGLVASSTSTSGASSPGAEYDTPQPFFDPYNKTSNGTGAINRDKILIRDDTYQLKVSLQNPFAFEIEINDITIVTEGDVTVQTIKNSIRHANQTQLQPTALGKTTNGSVSKLRVVTAANTSARRPAAAVPNGNQPLTSSSNTSNPSIVIPPSSTEQFIIAFKPLDLGELKVVGFNITVGGCAEQYFRIIDKELSNGLLKVKPNVLPSAKKSDTLTRVCQNLRDNNIGQRATTKNLVLNVIPPQPTLSLTGISVTNGWLMLLEGEKLNFTITLANHSSVLINYLSFSFWDSTIEPLNKKLSAAGGAQPLPASEIYEIEWYLLKFKPFKILNKQTIMEKYTTIEPASEMTIDYEITGRRGMKESKIVLEYAHKQSDDLSKSYIKYVHVPLNVSIMPSLDVVGCDVLPLFSSSLQGFEGDTGDLILENLENVLTFITKVIKSDTEEISDYCLFLVDLRNSWNEKLSCSLSYTFSSDRRFDVKEIIEPGKTTRFLVPVKRISSNEVDLTSPIPSLRNKQFVKNYSISEAEEMQMREVFWLRDVLLKRLSSSWETIETKATGKRSGNIELRTIRLTNKMANVLIYNKIRLLTTIIKGDEAQTPAIREGTQFLLETDEFYTIRTTIINYTETTINGILRHLPFPTNIISTISTNNPNFIKTQMSIDRKILINGVLQSPVSKAGIEPGQKLDVDLGFVILEKGEYEWGTVLDTLNKENLQIVGREPIFITAR